MAKDPSTHSMRVKLLRRLLIGAAALTALALVGLTEALAGAILFEAAMDCIVSVGRVRR